MSNMLPPIVATSDEVRRLCGLANSSMTLIPCVARFLVGELDRANVVRTMSICGA
jgi:hypothetical protein